MTAKIAKPDNEAISLFARDRLLSALFFSLSSIIALWVPRQSILDFGQFVSWPFAKALLLLSTHKDDSGPVAGQVAAIVFAADALAHLELGLLEGFVLYHSAEPLLVDE
jgi:hypothetical protein